MTCTSYTFCFDPKPLWKRLFIHNNNQCFVYHDAIEAKIAFDNYVREPGDDVRHLMVDAYIEEAPSYDDTMSSIHMEREHYEQCTQMTKSVYQYCQRTGKCQFRKRIETNYKNDQMCRHMYYDINFTYKK